MRGMRLVKFISYAPISGGYRAIDVYEEEALLKSWCKIQMNRVVRIIAAPNPFDRRQNDGTDKSEYIPHNRPLVCCRFGGR